MMSTMSARYAMKIRVPAKKKTALRHTTMTTTINKERSGMKAKKKALRLPALLITLSVTENKGVELTKKNVMCDKVNGTWEAAVDDDIMVLGGSSCQFMEVCDLPSERFDGELTAKMLVRPEDIGPATRELMAFAIETLSLEITGRAHALNLMSQHMMGTPKPKL